MGRPTRSVVCGLLLLRLAPSSQAQDDQRRGDRPASGLAIVGGYPAVAAGSFQFGHSGVPVPYLGMGGGGFVGPLPADQVGPGGLGLPHAPVGGSAARTVAASPARRGDPGRAEELILVGDRSFRGGNYRRAEDRYQLAARAHPASPTPHIHLAQVAVVRGDYKQAANHLRTAVAATRGAGWLLEARDIQAMYAEPGDFARQLARLESHLQTRPDDRNAWFVLGAQHFFSGRPRAAADAFLRLSDRPADEALAAFRDAATVAARAQTSAAPSAPK